MNCPQQKLNTHATISFHNLFNTFHNFCSRPRFYLYASKVRQNEMVFYLFTFGNPSGKLDTVIFAWLFERDGMFISRILRRKVSCIFTKLLEILWQRFDFLHFLYHSKGRVIFECMNNGSMKQSSHILRHVRYSNAWMNTECVSIEFKGSLKETANLSNNNFLLRQVPRAKMTHFN